MSLEMQIIQNYEGRFDVQSCEHFGECREYKPIAKNLLDIIHCMSIIKGKGFTGFVYIIAGTYTFEYELYPFV